MIVNENVNEFVDSVSDILDVPNTLLPKEYHDGRRRKEGYTSLRFVKNKLRKKKLIETEHQQLKTLKKSNIELYRSQVDAGQEIEYNVNDTKLSRNEQTFYTLMDRIGHFEDENNDD